MAIFTGNHKSLPTGTTGTITPSLYRALSRNAGDYYDLYYFIPDDTTILPYGVAHFIVHSDDLGVPWRH